MPALPRTTPPRRSPGLAHPANPLASPVESYWRGVLIALLIGLAATIALLWSLHPTWKPPGNLKLLFEIWGSGLLFTAVAASVSWWFAPSTLLVTAQKMDRKLDTKNRLETTAALHESNSPLAQAQRNGNRSLSRTRASCPARARPAVAHRRRPRVGDCPFRDADGMGRSGADASIGSETTCPSHAIECAAQSDHWLSGSLRNPKAKRTRSRKCRRSPSRNRRPA